MFKKTLALVALSVLTLSANAAIVTLHDGDLIDFDPNDNYSFSGTLSASDPIFSVGFNMDINEAFEVTITAPPEFSFLTVLTTQPNFGGSSLSNFNIVVAPGTQLTFIVDGGILPSESKWVSLGAESSAIAAIDQFYGGSYVLNGSSSAVVPIPATAWLFGSALLGLVGIGRKRKQV